MVSGYGPPVVAAWFRCGFKPVSGGFAMVSVGPKLHGFTHGFETMPETMGRLQDCRPQPGRQRISVLAEGCPNWPAR
jgi:hypothetical protein